MAAIWKKRESVRSGQVHPTQALSEAQALQMANELAVPHKLIELLFGRGIRQKIEIENYFSPKLKSLRDPLTIRDMKKAVERLEKAFDRGEKVCVYADYDLDGSSGLALLYQALKKIGFDRVTYYQPKRLTEGYGVHANAIEQLHGEGVRVIVTVDVGITAFEALHRARELGVDVILTDHHLPLNQLPEAFAIVNPNCSDCTSGLGHLSGAGVAFYLVLALRRHLMERQKLKTDFDPKSLLDFFVIGTLTDLVPLIDENRPLVRHGLKILSHTTRPGLRQLLIELNLYGRDLTSQDVAIQFAPKLNALSRMEIGLLPVDIFFVEDEEAAQAMISTVSANNKKRKSLQAYAEAWAHERALSHVHKGYAFVSSDNFHKGVIGLVATKLTQKFGVPSFVGSIRDNELVGSARAPERSGINLIEVFEFCREHLIRFGGHAQAAGFTMDVSKIESFESKLSEFFENRQVAEVVLEYDTEIDLKEINPKLLKFLNFLEPYGRSFQQPRFRLKGDLVSETSMSGGHKKLKVRVGEQTAELIFFSPPETINLRPGPTEFLVRLQKNYFRRQEELQILIDDARSF